ncbi:GNAT family N-acetyltransferase [Nocardioides stalactiti]|uniref:GNAT family N-acetyltransferase n=1 Tax=Nocardioides stalactiti TaxID=2755356 RepID=UPI001FE71D45|nr:GNAT family N-acetyltransferase [Nocardioides stalactiti]
MTVMDRVVEVRVVGYRHPDAVALVDRVQQEYVERYGSPDETPVDPAMFDPPDGLFLVAYADGVPVGTGAWRRTAVRALGGSAGVEIKRMYVVPEHRGTGLARRILAELEDSAAAVGADLLVLETGLMQPEAIALYESSGYVPVDGFGHYAASSLSRCFGKRL